MINFFQLISTSKTSEKRLHIRMFVSFMWVPMTWYNLLNWLLLQPLKQFIKCDELQNTNPSSVIAMNHATWCRQM